MWDINLPPSKHCHGQSTCIPQQTEGDGLILAACSEHLTAKADDSAQICNPPRHSYSVSYYNKHTSQDGCKFTIHRITLICWTAISKTARGSHCTWLMFHLYWLFTRHCVRCCVEWFNWPIRRPFLTSWKTLTMHFTKCSWSTAIRGKRMWRRMNSINKCL